MLSTDLIKPEPSIFHRISIFSVEVKLKSRNSQSPNSKPENLSSSPNNINKISINSCLKRQEKSEILSQSRILHIRQKKNFHPKILPKNIQLEKINSQAIQQMFMKKKHMSNDSDMLNKRYISYCIIGNREKV